MDMENLQFHLLGRRRPCQGVRLQRFAGGRGLHILNMLPHVKTCKAKKRRFALFPCKYSGVSTRLMAASHRMISRFSTAMARLLALTVCTGFVTAAHGGDTATNRFGFTGPEIFPSTSISLLHAADMDGDGSTT